MKKQEMDSGKEAVMSAYENLLEAQGHFRQAAEAAGMDLKHDAVAQFAKGKNKADALGHDVEQFVHDKPVATLGLAFVAGLLAAQLLSRK
ncbi:DUF883 C-terminal domain-containing protein [Haliea sp. E1-2-M8]|uniref:DUF883 C-terminal domain-containing protein n=1 Tax=Haliea sp. E1-2-M8 TaxID=3064706 RepID=UPI00271CEEC1|nr:DUF883 C-terminal domain-containing protein [Haliea sp. E1-2-M8]MDO8862277.1 DUF883 C-terminal domain-containing protein [Haliea sp. E1-2-M8]